MSTSTESTIPDAGSPPGPLTFTVSDHLARAHTALDELDAEFGEQQLATLKGYTDLLFGEYLVGGPAITIAWPRSWYIPSEADYRDYWILPPPADHRYQYSWANTINGKPAGSSASEKTGALFAWCNVSGLQPGYTGYAGTGARFTPSAQLSYVSLGAEVDLLAESRWWFLPKGTSSLARFDYRATVYVAAWEIDPVTGAWSLVRPFAARRVINRHETGQGGGPIQTDRHSFDDLATTVQLQGGRSYAVTVSFEAEVQHTELDNSGRPYQRRTDDDFKLWAGLTGTVPKITIETTKVLIP